MTNRIAKRAAALVVLLALAIACCIALPAGQAHATPVRPTDVTVASQGNCLLGVNGTFLTDGKAAVLARVNAIRKEACDQGVPNPEAPGSNLAPSDYVPIKWSSELEVAAQTRAAEGAINLSHTRPNGESCFTVLKNVRGQSCAENLAWNYSGMLQGIEQWYGEKADWVSRKSGAQTGHYEALIAPSNTHIGLGAFKPKQGGWTCTAGEFVSTTVALDENEVGVTGEYMQTVEVPASKVGQMAIQGKARLVGPESRGYSLEAEVNLQNVDGSAKLVSMSPLASVAWSSSDSSVVEVDATSGLVSAKGCGKATVKAVCAGKSASAKVTVVPEATSLKKVNAKKKALKVTWAKQTMFTHGYQIRYSQKRSMAKAKTATVKGAGKKAFTLKKLKSKKKYYVQVRTYAKVGGEYYFSDWSKAKSGKAK